MLSGTIQNDILKEYVARGTYIYPPRASLRIVTDIFAFCERELPNWNTISISGYHIREAGSTAVQEVAFTFANAIAYVQAAIDGGLQVDSFGQPPLVLLQRAQRFSRGSRQVPRRAAAVGAHHARPLRGHEPSRVAAPLPHPDGRQHAHRATARQQHCPRRPPGARRGTRRHSVAALQRPRRGAGAADRGVGADRAADAADHRVRERRREHDRPARRLVCDRGDDHEDRERARACCSSASRLPAVRWQRSKPGSSSARFRSRPTAHSSASTHAR